MLTARTVDTEYVEAPDAQKSVAYQCRGCRKPVVLHAGRFRRHFQHLPNTRCAFGTKMTLAHLETQRSLAAALRQRDVVVELEAWLPGITGDRRIDVLAHPIAAPARRVAIEVQQVNITVNEIAARSASYRAQDVAPLWLRLIDFKRFEDVAQIEGTGEIWIEKYTVQAWERWAHDQAGALWFRDTSAGGFWRGRFTKGFGWRESSEFYSSGGDQNYYPGGYTDVSRWVGMVLDGPYRPETLQLNRGRGRNRARQLTGWFEPGEQPAPPSPEVRRELRTVLRNTFLYEICELERWGDDQWIVADTVPAPSDWRSTRYVTAGEKKEEDSQ